MFFRKIRTKWREKTEYLPYGSTKEADLFLSTIETCSSFIFIGEWLLLLFIRRRWTCCSSSVDTRVFIITALNEGEKRILDSFGCLLTPFNTLKLR